MLKRLTIAAFIVTLTYIMLFLSAGLTIAEDDIKFQTSPASQNNEDKAQKDIENENVKIDINKFLQDKTKEDLTLFDKKNQPKPKKKVEMLVKAVPGDGLVKLSWQVMGFPKNVEVDDQQYVINYGTESGKLKKNINVGNSAEYTLRDLKNHQLYFIQVSAAFKLPTGDDALKSEVLTQKSEVLTLKSEVLKATPLPDDEHGGSILERSYSKNNMTLLDKYEADPFNRDLRQFGYDFFKNSAQLAGTMENMPVGGDYTIGPGDVLSINLWGSVNSRLEVTVDRNGEIIIPKVGSIKVWGVTYDQAKTVISKTINQYYKNYEINVTLGKLRTIQVFVVGEVEFPGSYPVSSLATVINALSAAGGPTKNGSLRTIKISRNGKHPVTIDLYDILLQGDRKNDIRLQNGDTLFVPVIGPVVAVAGEVKRPAIYETMGKVSLSDVLAMSGGVAASGYMGRIQVERFSGNSSKVILDYALTEGHIENSAAGDDIQDRDMVKVFPVHSAVRQVVSLKGNVVRPGEYQYHKGMRVLDIIKGFDMLLPESYLDAAEVTRLALPDYHKEILTFNLRKTLSGSSADNIPLQEQDSIKIFSRADMQEKLTVAINGEVVNPGTYDYYPGMTVRDLVTAGGGIKHNSLLEQAELSRVVLKNEKASSLNFTINLGKAMNGDPATNLVLQPDDALSVRSVSDWLEATDKFVTIKGEVSYPGVYAIARGEKISSVIARAGGFTEKAYLSGVKFTRKSVMEAQQKHMDDIITRTEKEIYQKEAAISSVASSKDEAEATRLALEGLLKQLEILKRTKAEGRVVIRLSPLDEFRKSSYDLDLEGKDTLDIPARPSVVHVMGQVYNPTSFVYTPEHSSVEVYLNKAGGPTRDGEESDQYIIRADGSVYSKQQSSFGIKWDDESRSWSFGSFYATHMSPGDTLVVPQKIERIAWLREIKDITTIISQIALTAGTVLIGLR
jgi:protein involved in polysaccharide export with SLBB domain